MATLNQFNALPTATAAALISRCCGSTRWVEEMVAARPYPSIAALTAAADDHWAAMASPDFLEAFQCHPKIGQRASPTNPSADPSTMAAAEQAGVADASVGVRDSLAQCNADYAQKFGFIFIVCATGQSAAQLLDAIRGRMDNPRATELAIAAEEQRKITHLRIHKLFTDNPR